MEIAQQIRRSGFRAWLLVLLPLIVGAAAFVVQSKQPPQYSGSATVLAPSATTQRTGAQYIADFQAALKSDTVADATAKELGLSSSQVQGGLAATPTAAGSTLLQVTWTGTSKDAATRVPGTASREAYSLLVKPRLNALQAQEKLLSKQYADAESAREAYTNQIGVQLPPQQYQSVLQLSNQLNSEYQKARSQGDTTAASTLSAQVDKANKSIKELAPQVIRYNRLTSDVNSSYTQLTQVRNDLSEAQGSLDSITAPGTVTTNAASKESTLVPLVRNVVGAAIVAFGVALLLLLGWSALFGPGYGKAEEPAGAPLLPYESQEAGWPGPGAAPTNGGGTAQVTGRSGTQSGRAARSR